MEISNHQFSLSARKKVLFSAMAAICQEAGFTSAENIVLDILVQMFQAFLSELSCSAKSFAEHSGRSEPLAGDVYMALIEMGFNVTSLIKYTNRTNRTMIPNPSLMSKQQTPKILQTGKRKQLLNYIPDYFPPFPDSHSYIATPTFKQPVTDYETLREKSSLHKRDIERALTRFMARTFHSSNTFSLFPDEQLSYLFPLVGIKVNNVPYLSAFFPKDRLLNDDTQFGSILQTQKTNNTTTANPNPNPNTHNSKKQQASSKTSATTANAAAAPTPSSSQPSIIDESNKINEPTTIDLKEATIIDETNINETIENPFLLPPKIVNIQ